MTEIRDSALHCLIVICEKIPHTRYNPWRKFGSRLFYNENILHLMIKGHFCGSCIVMKVIKYNCNKRRGATNSTTPVTKGIKHYLWAALIAYRSFISCNKGQHSSQAIDLLHAESHQDSNGWYPSHRSMRSATPD